MGAKQINLKPGEEYITLQSLLKIAGVVPTGGMVKIYLAETSVLVNGEREIVAAVNCIAETKFDYQTRYL